MINRVKALLQVNRGCLRSMNIAIDSKNEDDTYNCQLEIKGVVQNRVMDIKQLVRSIASNNGYLSSCIISPCSIAEQRSFQGKSYVVKTVENFVYEYNYIASYMNFKIIVEWYTGIDGCDFVLSNGNTVSIEVIKVITEQLYNLIGHKYGYIASILIGRACVHKISHHTQEEIRRCNERIYIGCCLVVVKIGSNSEEQTITVYDVLMGREAVLYKSTKSERTTVSVKVIDLCKVSIDVKNSKGVHTSVYIIDPVTLQYSIKSQNENLFNVNSEIPSQEYIRSLPKKVGNGYKKYCNTYMDAVNGYVYKELSSDIAERILKIQELLNKNGLAGTFLPIEPISFGYKIYYRQLMIESTFETWYKERYGESYEDNLCCTISKEHREATAECLFSVRPKGIGTADMGMFVLSYGLSKAKLLMKLLATECICENMNHRSMGFVNGRPFIFDFGTDTAISEPSYGEPYLHISDDSKVVKRLCKALYMQKREEEFMGCLDAERVLPRMLVDDLRMKETLILVGVVPSNIQSRFKVTSSGSLIKIDMSEYMNSKKNIFDIGGVNSNRIVSSIRSIFPWVLRVMPDVAPRVRTGHGVLQTMLSAINTAKINKVQVNVVYIVSTEIATAEMMAILLILLSDD